MTIRQCEPDLVEIVAGWLATTPRDHPYRIGVVGQSPDEARRRFEAAVAAWGELHARGTGEAQTRNEGLSRGASLS
jgi:hypothetical protein